MSSQSPKSCQDKTIHSPSPSTKFSKPNLCPSPEGKDNQSDLPSQVIESPYSSSSEERNDEYDIIEITHPGPDSIPHSNFDKSSHSPNLIDTPMEKGSSTPKDASDDETQEFDLPLLEIDWKPLYAQCPKWKPIWVTTQGPKFSWPPGFIVSKGYLYHGHKLCVPSLVQRKVIHDYHVS
jgi:hypothetical protein